MPDEPNADQIVTPSPATGAVNTDGSFADNWSDKYGADNQAHLSRYKDFDSLVNSHIDTKKKFGKDPNSLAEIPSETSSDEVKSAWRTARGVPDALDGYEYAMSDEHATKLGPLDDAKMAAFREFANSEDWSAKQFKNALDFYHTNIAGELDSSEIAFNESKDQAAADAKVELQKKPGWQTPAEYDAKVQAAQSIIDKYGLAEGIEDLNLQNSPKMVEGLNNISAAMSEDNARGSGPDTGGSLENINSQIANLRSEQGTIRAGNPVNFKSDPKFKDIESRLKALYQQKPV